MLCWACWSPWQHASTVGDTQQALAHVGRRLWGCRLTWRAAGPDTAAFRAWLVLRCPSPFPFPMASLCTAVPLEIAVAMVFPKKTHLPPFPTSTPHRLNLVTAVMTRLPKKGHFT